MKTQSVQQGRGGMLQNIPTEAQEQRILFQWINFNKTMHPELGLCFHIPNGGSRNTLEAHNLKQQGVKAGVPDICLPVARGPYHGLYIELKRVRNGKLSNDQRRWLGDLTKQGYRAVMCRGWEEARKEIEAYLNI